LRGAVGSAVSLAVLDATGDGERVSKVETELVDGEGDGVRDRERGLLGDGVSLFVCEGSLELELDNGM